MFERFTQPARAVVVLAQEHARMLGAEEVGSIHMLVGACETDGPAATLLAAHGITGDDARTAARTAGAASRLPDAEALADLGIDLDEIRRRVEETFGPGALEGTRAAGRRARRRAWGHLRFTADAKKTLELALREAIRRGDGHVGTEHLLLGFLHPQTGAAGDLLRARGLTLAGVRAELEGPGRAAG
ncbi:ATPase [Actinomycetospora endophytica]|uniref:ATPase n=1 Tax=Actinomycetospora endophytica TaxID=2291215 RepID=A0ABS8PB63_9PSEU|nr:Clp protease N-terminal domain-containing protein [Actinomycetospora endophytica]MCD2195453.1 ATPase [Actinomycetospora endophytica]